MFIVFEGIDGAGKTTQARELAHRLEAMGLPTLLTREPGGTPLGETVRDWVKSGQGITPLAELFLISAARTQLVENVIRPSLAAGVTVISDRFFASTIAYQGYGRGLDLDFVKRVNREAAAGLTPNVTVLLDLAPEVGARRKSDVGRGEGDNFDTAPLDFRESVRQGYLDQAADDPSRWLVVDGSMPMERVAQEIWAKIQPLLAQEGLLQGAHEAPPSV